MCIFAYRTTKRDYLERIFYFNIFLAELQANFSSWGMSLDRFLPICYTLRSK